MQNPLKVLGLIILAIISAVGLLSSFEAVGASRVGVLTIFGEVTGGTIPEGLHLKNPFASVREVNLSIDRVDANRAEGASKDLQSVHSDLVVNYRVDSAKVVELFRLNPSLDYEDRIAQPAIYEAFKSVIARYSAEELVSKRAEVSDGVLTAVREKLAPYHIIIESVNLVNFGFSKAFNDAIELKVTASQQAETAKRNLERVQYEAQQSIARAEGEAKAIAIQVAAIKENGGDEYIRLKAIEKWDGKLPTTTGGAVPFLDISRQGK